MTKKEYHFQSANGVDTLYGVAYVPDGTFAGYIQFLHDRYEHISRYESIMERFCEEGFLVFGHDHMGHGRSSESPDTLGRFGGENNQFNLIEDAKRMFYCVVADYQPTFQKQSVVLGRKKPTSYEAVKPTLRCIIGVGLGAEIARAYVVKHQDCNAVVYCGDQGFSVSMHKELRQCQAEIKKMGPDAVPEKLTNTIYENYNRYFDGEDMNRWHSSLAGAVKKYNSDPLCHFEYDLKSWDAMLRLQTMYRERDWLVLYPKYLATYFMSGYMDPVSRYTKTLDPLLNRFRYSNKMNVFFKYYENCRHDLFFDESRNHVMQDILKFINCVLQQQC